MDEEKFKTHAEKEFWEKVFIAAISFAGRHANMAAEQADDAIFARRLRMQGLIKPGVKPAP